MFAGDRRSGELASALECPVLLSHHALSAVLTTLSRS